MGHQFDTIFGEVSERFMELVLKTSDSARGRGFESLSLRHFYMAHSGFYIVMEKYPSGDGAPLLRE